MVLANGDEDWGAEVTVADGQVVPRDGVDGPTMALDPASGDLEVAGSVKENSGG